MHLFQHCLPFYLQRVLFRAPFCVAVNEGSQDPQNQIL